MTLAPTAFSSPAVPPCPFAALDASVGRTPLMRFEFVWRDQPVTVFAKAEMYNFSGSIKDRMALNILRCARASGGLRPGQSIAEATSGNAGIAFAAIGSALGHPVTIFMPDWMSAERKALLASYGADVRLVSRGEGGFPGAIARAEALGRDEGFFLPRQFCNDANADAHATGTASELWLQMQMKDQPLSAFVAGVGTGGTVMGAARFLKARDPSIAVHPVEPAESPTLSTGYKIGHHRMQGISDDFIPDLVKLGELDDIMAVHDGDAILMAQQICRRFGLGIGISSGGNLVAAIKAAARHEGAVATVLADNHSKYLSTDLMRDEPVRPDYVTPELDFIRMQIIPYPSDAHPSHATSERPSALIDFPVI